MDKKQKAERDAKRAERAQLDPAEVVRRSLGDNMDVSYEECEELWKELKMESIDSEDCQLTGTKFFTTFDNNVLIFVNIL